MLLPDRLKHVSPVGHEVAEAEGTKAKAINARARVESLRLVIRTTLPL